MVERPERYLSRVSKTVCLAHCGPSTAPMPTPTSNQPRLKRKRPNWSSTLVVVVAALVSTSAQVSAASDLHQDRFTQRTLVSNIFEPPVDIDKAMPEITLEEGSIEIDKAPAKAPGVSGRESLISPSPILTNDSEDTSIPLAPTESPAPTPSPSKEPTSTPSVSVSPSRLPTFSPTDTSGPTPSPSEMPTFSPSKVISQAPTSTPSKIPTATPTTAPPTLPPTPRPATQSPTDGPTTTRDPTSSPTISPTRDPTSGPTKAPTESPTTSPSTSFPSRSPTLNPTNTPSETASASPTPKASGSPTLSRLPSLSPITPSPTNAPSRTERPSMTYTPTFELSFTSALPQAVPVEDVPITPFEVLLAFDEPLSATDEATATAELEVAVTDYLMRELSGEDFGEGVELGSFALTVSPASGAARKLRFFRGLQSMAQIYTYDVDGTADFSSGGELDTATLGRAVDSSVNDMFEGTEGSQAFTEFLQTETESEVVRNTAGAFVETQELPPLEEDPGGKEKPSTVSIVIGFVIVGLAALSLLFYAYTWFKGYRKKAAQRKRERQGVHGVPQKSATASRVTNSARASQPPQQQQQAPPVPVPPGFLASSNITAPRVDSSSEDDSSYQGVDSEDSGDNDAFARELKLAATLDKRAWEDFQHKTQELEDKGMVVGSAPPESSSRGGAAAAVAAGALASAIAYRAVSDRPEEDRPEEDEGFEITHAGSTLIIGPTDGKDDYQPEIAGTTFPYGDEEEDLRRADPPGPRGSTVAHRSPKRLNDPAGVRGSQLAIISPAAEEYSEGIELNAAGVAQSSRLETFHDDDSDSDFDPATMLMNSLTANTGAATARARYPTPRYSPTSQSIDPSIPSSQAFQLSQASTSSDPRASARGASAMPALNEVPSTDDDDDTEDQQQSKDSNSLQSLLTIDIVKEVQKLSQFVKKYERKREKEKMKEAVREEREVVSWSPNDSRSIPSVSYDTLSEGGRFSRPEEVEDDGSESESSQSSWSSGGDVVQQKPVVRSRKYTPNLSIQVDVEDSSSVDSEKGKPTFGSDESRLGITPFSVQKLMAAKPDADASRRRIAERQALKTEPKPVPPPIPKPVSKPPATGWGFSPTVLSPIPGTPETPGEKYESPTKRRAPLNDIPRNVEQIRTPESTRFSRKLPRGQHSPTEQVRTPEANRSQRKSLRGQSSPIEQAWSPESNQLPRKSPIAQRSPVEQIRTPEPSQSQRKSPIAQRSPMSSNGYNQENGVHDSLRVNLAARDSRVSLPPKSRSGKNKHRLSSLRMHESIADADPEIMSALAPSDEGGRGHGMVPSDEETTRDGSQRDLDTPSPGFKITPRKSKNKGFNNILSMFEAKPSKEAMFPPSENWQYNH